MALLDMIKNLFAGKKEEPMIEETPVQEEQGEVTSDESMEAASSEETVE